MSGSDFQQLQAWRRAFHRYPESGWCEFVTTATIVAELREMGFDVKLGPEIIHRDFILGRDDLEVADALSAAASLVDEQLLAQMDGLPGCAAILETGKPGPVFAFRFDIDCVQVQESSDPLHRPHAEGFTSQRAGLMHACGHDGHAAIGLGVASWLMKNRANLAGTFKLIFQPAEEGVRGARPIVESGLLDDVDYFLAMHLAAGVKAGEVWLDPDGFQCTTKLDFYFYGEPAHAGADPHKGRNALAGACNAAMLMLAAPRHGEGNSRVNVGTIRAGEGRNIIPSTALLQVEVRGDTQVISDFMATHVSRCAQSSALAYDLECEKKVMGEAIDLVNSPKMVALLTDVINDLPELALSEGVSSGGSEDVTLMVRRVQQRGGLASYFIVGSALPGGHHQSLFDFDEEAMVQAVSIFTSAIKAVLR